jgi:hypothetical protein
MQSGQVKCNWICQAQPFREYIGSRFCECPYRCAKTSHLECRVALARSAVPNTPAAEHAALSARRLDRRSGASTQQAHGSSRGSQRRLAGHIVVKCSVSANFAGCASPARTVQGTSARDCCLLFPGHTHTAPNTSFHTPRPPARACIGCSPHGSSINMADSEEVPVVKTEKKKAALASFFGKGKPGAAAKAKPADAAT